MPPPDDAVALLWSRYHAELARLAAALGQEETMAAKTVQDAFGALLRRPYLQRDAAAAYSWLIRVVVAQAHARRASREPVQPPCLSITTAMLTLPARQRKCVVLRYGANLPATEVAELLRVPSGSVTRLGQDGLRRLAVVLGDEHHSAGDMAAVLRARLSEVHVPESSWEAVRPRLLRRLRKQRTSLVSAAACLALGAAIFATVANAASQSGHQAGHRNRPHRELAIKGDQVPVTLAGEPDFLVYLSGRDLGAAAGISAGNAAEPARYNDITLAPGRPGLSYSAPSVNSARTRVVFVQAPAGQLKETDGEGDIAVAALNGSDLHVLTRTGVDADPVWSPDGKQVAFLRDNRVWLMSASGADQHLLGLYLAADSIAWSPNGKDLAVTSIAYSVSRIAIMNIAGASYTWFTPVTGPGQYQPAWSPDGRQLVYGQSGQNALFISNLNGSGTRRLTTCSRPCQQDSEPAWSPDGSLIAFVRSVRGVRQIAVVPADGGPVRYVTAGPRRHDEPAW